MIRLNLISSCGWPEKSSIALNIFEKWLGRSTWNIPVEAFNILQPGTDGRKKTSLSGIHRFSKQHLAWFEHSENMVPPPNPPVNHDYPSSYGQKCVVHIQNSKHFLTHHDTPIQYIISSCNWSVYLSWNIPIYPHRCFLIPPYPIIHCFKKPICAKPLISLGGASLVPPFVVEDVPHLAVPSTPVATLPGKPTAAPVPGCMELLQGNEDVVCNTWCMKPFTHYDAHPSTIVQCKWRYNGTMFNFSMMIWICDQRCWNHNLE